jgi:tetratricopeptide (TPR) repeat protein
LFLHLDEHEHAHDLLKKSPATKSDPWLVAGEIALASAAGRKPSFLKVGNEMLEDGDFQPLHVSELASAIGTVHLRDGNRKARKLFGKSLIDPTGNSLAQAEWANPRLGGEMVSTRQIDQVLDSGEARAFQAYWAGDFGQLRKVCELWMKEEPFSTEPFSTGSFASIINDETDNAIKLAREGLKLDPDSLLLQNHLAYGLIAKGEFIEASQILRHAMFKKTEDQYMGYLLATAGMLMIRLGDLEPGIASYKSAISVFKRQGNRGSEASAAAFLALEVTRAEGSMSDEFIKQAEDLSKDLRYTPENKIVLDRAKRWRFAVRHRSQLLDTTEKS